MRNKGFTLIELLVVILIVGILLSLLVPNLVLFQERARRASVKNNIHVIQTALEAYAVDHFGKYPGEDLSFEPDDDAGIALYMPGGDVFGIEGEPRLGSFPVNPYTGTRYNTGDYEDLNYEDFFGEFEPGQNAAIRGDDEIDCPYLDMEGEPEVAGSVYIGSYVNEGTEMVEEYGIAGWGRDPSWVPMYDLDPMCDDPTDEESFIFFALHN